MQRIGLRITRKLLRVVSLVLLAVLGTSMLVRFAPGYFTDSREMDAVHAAGADLQLQELRAHQTDVSALLHGELGSLLRGDLGRSRQYQVPVSDLLRARVAMSAGLLWRGLSAGWLFASLLALVLSARRGAGGEVLITGTSALLLALPIGALATVCLLLNAGGPVFALALLVAVRDFKLLYRLLRVCWQAPFLLYGRAQGLTFPRLVLAGIVPTFGRELLALAMMSFVLGLSALVPIEVIFDLPGLGQLAWSAATNRDLPVLVAVTALLAACVGVAGMFASPARATELAECA